MCDRAAGLVAPIPAHPVNALREPARRRRLCRALRVARTIADLATEVRMSAMRLAEALQYRAYEVRRLVAP